MQKQLKVKFKNLKTDKTRTKLNIAFGMNIAIFALVLFASVIMFGNWDAFEWTSQWHEGIMSFGEKLKFFTVLSNLLMGLVAGVLIVMISLMKAKKIKIIHKSIYILDLVATAGVALTMLVTLFILTPFGTLVGEKFFTPDKLFVGANLCFHLLIPLLSIISFVAFLNTQEIKLKESLYAFVPIGLYFIFYICMALTHIDKTTGLPLAGYDWYRMFQFGYLAAAGLAIAVLGLAFLIIWLLWLGNRKIQAKRIVFSYVLNGILLILGIAQTTWMFLGSGEIHSHLKYFTNQSNWLMTIAVFVYLILMILKDTKVLKRMCMELQVFNLLTTVAVAVTFLSVVGFMVPWTIAIDHKNPWTEPGVLANWNMLFHIITPLFAVLTYLTVNHCPDMKFKRNWESIIICGTYMLFYAISAYKHMDPETGKIPEGYDWYGIITAFGDATALLFVALIALNFGVSALLWWGNRNIHFDEPKSMPYKKLREQLWFIRRWW